MALFGPPNKFPPKFWKGKKPLIKREVNWKPLKFNWGFPNKPLTFPKKANNPG